MTFEGGPSSPLRANYGPSEWRPKSHWERTGHFILYLAFLSEISPSSSRAPTAQVLTLRTFVHIAGAGRRFGNGREVQMAYRIQRRFPAALSAESTDSRVFVRLDGRIQAGGAHQFDQDRGGVDARDHQRAPFEDVAALSSVSVRRDCRRF